MLLFYGTERGAPAACSMPDGSFCPAWRLWSPPRPDAMLDDVILRATPS